MSHRLRNLTRIAFTVWFFVVLAWLCTSAEGQTLDRPPLDPAVKTGVLPNGIHYFLRHNEHPQGRAALHLVVNAGSVLETEAQLGLAHLLEHMAFNGSARFPAQGVVDYLQSLGIKFGPEVNAYTSFDETIYTIEVPTDNAASLQKGLEILDDWSRNLTLSEKELIKERLVVQEEWRRSQGAEQRAGEDRLAVLFADSLYANRRPIGKPEVFLNAPLSQLRSFYETWYRPENLAIVLVGDFDPAKVEAAIRATFTAPKSAKPLVRPQLELPNPVKSRALVQIHTDKELAQTTIDISYRQPKIADPGSYANYRRGIINNLINEAIAVRFGEAAAKEKTPYARASGYLASLSRTSESFLFRAVPKPGQNLASLTDLLTEIERLKRYGLTQGELDSQKAATSTEVARLLAEKDHQESKDLASELGTYYLRGIPAPGIGWESIEISRILDKLTLTEVNKVLQEALSYGDVATFVATTSEVGPDALAKTVVESIRQKVASATITPFQTATKIVSLVDAKPAKGQIKTVQTDPGTAIQTWTLSNGAKVLWKTTSNKQDEVSLNALSLSGTSVAAAADYVSATLAAQLAQSSGLGGIDQTQLKQYLQDKTAGLGLSIDTHTVNLTGSANQKDLPILFQMLYLWFTNPRVTEDGAKAFLSRYAQTLAQREQDPDAIFNNRITSVLSADHPRYRPIVSSDLPSVQPEKAQTFLASILNPAAFTFSFAGTIDPAQFRDLVETWLASIPAKPVLDSRNLGLIRPSGADVAVRKGSAPKGTAMLAWYAPVTYNYQQVVISRVLNEILNVRLDKEIREKLGGSYDVQGASYLSLLPDSSQNLLVRFGSDPKRIDELTKAVQATLEALKSGPITDDQMATAKALVKKTREKDWEDNGTVAGFFSSLDRLQHEPFSRIVDYPKLVDGVTVADLKAFLTRVLATKMNRVVLLPEAN